MSGNIIVAADETLNSALSSSAGEGGKGPNEVLPQKQIFEYQVKFTGSAREYFKIWIVNLFLSIITLGIYSAWAKVRRLRYFYGNTWIDGHNFEYHAKPKQILIGRLIVVAGLIAFNVILTFFPPAYLLVVVIYLVFPWLVKRSITFNARVTSHRNVRFDFDGRSYWRVLFVFLVMPVLAVFTLGLLYPVTKKLYAEYVGNGLSFGQARFNTKPPTGQLYSNFFLMLLVGIGAILALFAVVFALIFAAAIFQWVTPEMQEALKQLDKGTASLMTIIIAGLGNLLGILTVLVFIRIPAEFYYAGNRNIVMNSTRLDEKYILVSGMKRLRYAWIMLSNMLVTISTLGLMHPWSAIRSWRYIMASSAIHSFEPIADFVSKQTDSGSAVGAEFMDIEGFDFGF